MHSLLRRLRGAVGVGLTWGVSWTVIGTMIGLVIGVIHPDLGSLAETTLMLGLQIGLVGFISGVVFGMILSFAEGRKSLRDLSLLRVALWGAVGAATLPLLTPMHDEVMMFTSSLGAISAAATVALARRGQRRDASQAAVMDAEVRTT